MTEPVVTQPDGTDERVNAAPTSPPRWRARATAGAYREAMVFGRAISRSGPGVRWLLAAHVLATGLLLGVQRWMQAQPGLSETSWRAVLVFGEKSETLIAQGQVWRLASAGMLHGGAWHFVVNLVVLGILGGVVERVYGTHRLLIVHGLGLLGGTAASLVFTPRPSVGASGALFALCGLLLVLARRHQEVLPTRLLRAVVPQLLLYVGFGIALGLVSEVVDQAAHLGGLLVGVGLGFVLRAPAVEGERVHHGLRVATALAITIPVYGIAMVAHEASTCGVSVNAWSQCYGDLVSSSAGATDAAQSEGSGDADTNGSGSDGSGGAR